MSSQVAERPEPESFDLFSEQLDDDTVVLGYFAVVKILTDEGSTIQICQAGVEDWEALGMIEAARDWRKIGIAEMMEDPEI